MVTIQLAATVDKNGQLTAQVPDSIPPGPINIIIQSPETSTSTKTASARETARAKLAAAGLLSTAHRLPPNTRIPSDAEVEAAGKLPADARPSEDLINEDRNET